jgi:DNA-binding NtrC family response regulator
MHTVLVAIRDPEVRSSLVRIATGSERSVISVRSCREARRRFPGRVYDVVFAEAEGEGGTWGTAIPACGTAVLVDPQDQGHADDPLPPGFHARISTPFDAARVSELVAGRVLHDAPGPKPEGAAASSGALPTRLLGRTPAMRELRNRIRRVAPAQAPVLIVGETGSGKELVARQLHELSDRSEGPFVAINCGALSPTLLESQLFGHERGSFTGASRRHRGVFERAHGGTVFLDEVTEISVDVQVNLLRVLEQGVFYRTGGEELVEADFRVVAATNRAPALALNEGRLRSDLYYRLSALQLEVPRLRDRLADVQLLAEAFLDEVASEEGASKTLTAATLERLREHTWPGNVRELRNAIHTAYLMSEGSEIHPDALPAEVLTDSQEEGPVFHLPWGTSIEEAERELIMRTLHATEGSKPCAAESLGISLKTLYNRLNSYDELPASSSSGEPGPIAAHA